MRPIHADVLPWTPGRLGVVFFSFWLSRAPGGSDSSGAWSRPPSHRTVINGLHRQPRESRSGGVDPKTPDAQMEEVSVRAPSLLDGRAFRVWKVLHRPKQLVSELRTSSGGMRLRTEPGISSSTVKRPHAPTVDQTRGGASGISTGASHHGSRNERALSFGSPKCKLKARDRDHGSPNGVRTRVSTLRGWCPRPLDDGTAPSSSDRPSGY